MPVYYPLWIAAGGHHTIRRGPDCAKASDAAAIIKEKLAKGYASTGLVVQVRADGTHDVMGSSIYPPSARKVIDHYEQILAAIDPAEREGGRPG